MVKWVSLSPSVLTRHTESSGLSVSESLDSETVPLSGPTTESWGRLVWSPQMSWVLQRGLLTGCTLPNLDHAPDSSLDTGRGSVPQPTI